jgi:hypothetical protein
MLEVGEQFTGKDGNVYEILTVSAPGVSDDGHDLYVVTLKEALRASS